MTTYFIIDIDGTVSNSLPRVKRLCNSLGLDYEKDKDKIDLLWNNDTMAKFLYEEDIMKDEVVFGAENIMDIVAKCNACPIFLTGRSCVSKNATRKWLKEKLDVPDDVPLYMRLEDMKGIPTADCKEQIFIDFHKAIYCFDPDATYIFFEDDEETAKRYSKYGLVLKSPECWSFIL